MSLLNQITCRLIINDYIRLRQIEQTSSEANQSVIIKDIKKQLSHISGEQKELIKNALGKSNWSTLSSYIENHSVEETSLLA